MPRRVPAAASPPRLLEEVSSRALLGLAEVHAPAVPDNPPPLLDVVDIARYLGITPDVVRELIRRQQLAAIRVGRQWRVDPRDLQTFLAASRQSAIGTARARPAPLLTPSRLQGDPVRPRSAKRR